MAKVSFDVAKVMDALAKQEAVGYQFYEDVAENMDDKTTKKMFEKLAEDERKHEAFYLKQLEKYRDKAYTIDEHDASFMAMLLAQPSAVDIAKDAAKDKIVWNKRQALAIAEQLERDTILFLSQIVHLNEEFSEEPAFLNALKEEKMHLTMILDQVEGELSRSLML